MSCRHSAVHGFCLPAQAYKVNSVKVIQQRTALEQFRVSEQYRRHSLDHVCKQFPRIGYRSNHQLQNKAKVIFAMLSSYLS